MQVRTRVQTTEWEGETSRLKLKYWNMKNISNFIDKRYTEKDRAMATHATPMYSTQTHAPALCRKQKPIVLHTRHNSVRDKCKYMLHEKHI